MGISAQRTGYYRRPIVISARELQIRLVCIKRQRGGWLEIGLSRRDDFSFKMERRERVDGTTGDSWNFCVCGR